jgi:hypothetical protein
MIFTNYEQRKQSGSTCYFEFQKGGRSGLFGRTVFWQVDSLYLHMDIVDSINLAEVIPGFNYYGITIIDKAFWATILNNTENASGVLKEIMNDLCPWAEENFRENKVFVIHGI